MTLGNGGDGHRKREYKFFYISFHWIIVNKKMIQALYYTYNILVNDKHVHKLVNEHEQA